MADLQKIKEEALTELAETVQSLNAPEAYDVNIEIREYNEVTDKAFLYKTFVACTELSSLSFGCHPTLVKPAAAKLLENYLIPNCKIYIACPQDDMGLILGFLICENVDGIFCSHLVYTKAPFRRLGVATKLFKHAGHDIKDSNLSGLYTIKNAKAHNQLNISHNLIYHPLVLLKGVYGKQNY